MHLVVPAILTVEQYVRFKKKSDGVDGPTAEYYLFTYFCQSNSLIVFYTNFKLK